MTVGKNIAELRKQKGWTQAELGERIGVSNQAVSKWEVGVTMPDIALLPRLADVFSCSIDALFSREAKVEPVGAPVFSLPWDDDGVLRGVVYEGRRMLKRSEVVDTFTFEIVGDAKNVKSECSISVSGSVSCGCNAGCDIIVSGSLSGGSNCGGDITVGGNLSGGCNCGGEIVVGRNCSGDVNCREITVGGDVEADRIKGNVICKSLECDRVEGDVIIQK